MLLAATRRHPGLRRLVLGLALGDRAPAALRDHWVVQAVLEQESPDTTIRVRRQGFQVLMPAKFVESYLRRSWEPMTTTRL
ncbi:MAG TPA: hypothetical protein VNO23_05295, partial [Candidatus Binatia bacterium]|nr:hypothetical protein [Candidatus Binatia bacterium]